MHYADTDFFLALIKGEDWLKKNATKIYNENKGNIRTSLPVMIELMLLASEYKLDPETIVTSSVIIAYMDEGEKEISLIASHLIKEKNMSVFDAFVTASAGTDAVISSDKNFDKIGMKRIKLE